MGAASSYALGLAGLGEAAAFSAGDDYKALVCVFLYGGNDHNAMLVPFDATNYARYAEIRGGDGEGGGGLTPARSDLSATVLSIPPGQVTNHDITYALSPAMPNLARLYASGDMAPLLNVGPLLAPMTLAQYKSGAVPRPPKLFSHNDQQSSWQAYSTEGATIGAGGRMGDLAMSSNHNALFTCMSAAGNAVFLSGQRALSYQISPNGAIPVNGVKGGVYGSRSAGDALSALLTQANPHVLAADHCAIVKRSIEAEAFVTAALEPVRLGTSFAPASGSNGLAGQLNVVARLIAARRAMGVKRQVFMVSMGGFDTHDNQPTKHPQLMGQLDFALSAFHAAMVELGVADKVTTFTASDFGRTLASNGDGSDHGWGSHHLVMGGAVRGGRYYGTAPAISLKTEDQVGNGRLLPTTSVDQYMGTLGRWFGVADSELSAIAPNLGRFATPDLGFMAPAA
ncbi:DUF1501 domain-containing protein [Qipengyuania sp.]|uniref:DUF1501 domain-containing protein n=1 Tax=Qipengyuania sp. TaxID=2004515 RepID=UPI0035C80AAD